MGSIEEINPGPLGPESQEVGCDDLRAEAVSNEETQRADFDARIKELSAMVLEGSLFSGTFVRLKGEKPRYAVEFYKHSKGSSQRFRHLLSLEDHEKLVGDTPAYFERLECLESSERGETYRVSLVWPAPIDMPEDYRQKLIEKREKRLERKQNVVHQARDAKVIARLIRKCEREVDAGKLEKGTFIRKKGAEFLWHHVLQEGVSVIYEPAKDEPPASEIMNRTFPLYYTLGRAVRHPKYGLSILAQPVEPYPEQQRQRIMDLGSQ